MGDMEMIRIATGERTRFMQDGTVIKDRVNPPTIEWCDSCETYKRFNGSFNDDYNLIWICQDCKDK